MVKPRRIHAGTGDLNLARYVAIATHPFAGWQPVVWLGIISVTGQALNVCIFEMVRRRVDTNSHRAVARTLTTMTALLVVCYLSFALAGIPLVRGCRELGVLICRNINQPLQTVWVNQHGESRVRATIISMTSQADAIGQIVGGPVVSAVGLLTPVRAALVIGGVILSPALLLYVRTLRLDARTTFAMEEATQ
jgi:MFS transporter, DHA3 family, tetracycline resistance protein